MTGNTRPRKKEGNETVSHVNFFFFFGCDLVSFFFCTNVNKDNANLPAWP